MPAGSLTRPPTSPIELLRPGSAWPHCEAFSTARAGLWIVFRPRQKIPRSVRTAHRCGILGITDWPPKVELASCQALRAPVKWSKGLARGCHDGGWGAEGLGGAADARQIAATSQLASGIRSIPAFRERAGASTRIRNSTRQRGKNSEKVADPGLVTKWLVKEGVDAPLGVGRPGAA